MSSFFFSFGSSQPLQTHFPPLSGHSFTRTAGPPADYQMLLFWSLIGLCAFASLLWLPQLALRSAIKSKEQRELQAIQDQIACAQNDIRSAAYHFWGCCAVMLAYDLTLRALSLVFLTPRQLFVQQYFPLNAVNQTVLCGTIESLNSLRVPLGVGRIPTCSEVPSIAGVEETARLRDGGRVIGGSLGALSPHSSTPFAMNALTINTVAGPFNTATAEGSTLLVSQLTVAIVAAFIVLAFLSIKQWRSHTRKYIRGELPQQLPLPAAHAFVPRREPMAVNTFYVMSVWLLVLLAAFGYKRAMPLVMRLVFPAAICFSGAFSLLVQ